MRVCQCTFPAMHGGSTKCCEQCPNNFEENSAIGRLDKIIKTPNWTYTSPIKKKITVTEYDENGKIKKITETEE